MKIGKLQLRILIILGSFLSASLLAGSQLFLTFRTTGLTARAQSPTVPGQYSGLSHESSPRSVVELYLNRSLAGEFDQILPLIRERPEIYHPIEKQQGGGGRAGVSTNVNIESGDDSHRVRKLYPDFLFTRQFKESRLYQEVIEGNQAKLLVVLTNRETGAATIDAFLLYRENSDDNWRIFKVVDPGWAQDYPIRASESVVAK
jgi:hypothetical protein